MRLFSLGFLLFVVLFAFGQNVTAKQRFSIDNLDRTADPCTDFYQFACGNWLKNTEIPADQSQWLSFVELDERNQFTMRDILDKAAVPSTGRSSTEQKIGDFYGSCMDEAAVEAKGSAPVKPDLARIAAVKDKAALIDELARVHLQGARGLFAFYSSPDLHNADMVVG